MARQESVTSLSDSKVLDVPGECRDGGADRLASQPASTPLAFVCGPTSFVETVAENLIGLGYPLERVKTERFGGT